MSRALLILANDTIRQRAIEWIRIAPEGTRVELKAPKRSGIQNALCWAMLTDVASQAEHNGRKYNTNQWKCIFLHALGHETEFIPSLDNKTFLPLGQSSSDLSKAEMSALIDFIQSWGAEHGIHFHDETSRVQQTDKA